MYRHFRTSAINGMHDVSGGRPTQMKEFQNNYLVRNFIFSSPCQLFLCGLGYHKCSHYSFVFSENGLWRAVIFSANTDQLISKNQLFFYEAPPTRSNVVTTNFMNGTGNVHETSNTCVEATQKYTLMPVPNIWWRHWRLHQGIVKRLLSGGKYVLCQ